MKQLVLSGVKRAVIVAPHPDDEAIGAFGLIRSLRAQRARIRVIIVTDGTGSHPHSSRWPAPKLAALRRRETLAVLRHIHVGKREVTFLGLPDGGLSILSSRAAGVLNRAIGRVSNCDLLVLPASDDDHPDHRAVATIARRSAKARRRYEYLVWPNRQAPCRSATHRLVLGPVAAAKRGAIRRYRSQTGAIIDDPGGFTITRSELAAFSHPVEQFRAVRP